MPTEISCSVLSLCCMEAVPIRIYSGHGGWKQMKASFRKNWRHYMQEALGLAIFMVSACFFSALLFSPKSFAFEIIPNTTWRNVLMGILMGKTALIIFYSKWTAPSGAHINPAVTLTFLRLNKMCRYDALFFILFQVTGGTLAVYMMQWIMDDRLTAAPVYSAITIPGHAGIVPALFTELSIAFVTMTMVLFTSHHPTLKTYTKLLAACLVCCWVIVAGPLSGFGMNPARSFASALPSGIWTAFWLYLFIPVAGMLLAAEFFLFIQKRKSGKMLHTHTRTSAQLLEPLEFLL